MVTTAYNLSQTIRVRWIEIKWCLIVVIFCMQFIPGSIYPYLFSEVQMFIIGYQFVTIKIIWNLCTVKNPEFWTQRPLTERMKRVAADDVRFLLRIRHMMLKRMGQLALWQLGIRGSLYCRCFCKDDDKFQDWPGLPGPPGLYFWGSGCTRILFYFVALN